MKRYETEEYERFPNERAKLRNSYIELSWYCFRVLRLYGWRAENWRTSLDFLQNLPVAALNEDLFSLDNWKKKLENAAPEEANQLFYDCWIFLHNTFDHKFLKQ